MKLNNKKRVMRSLISVSSLLIGFYSSAYAADMNIDSFWVRDYLDFAQNRGQFIEGRESVEVKLKDGSTFTFPNLPIPNFRAVANKGATTSIGGAYTVSASHNIKILNNGNPVTHHAIYNQNFAQTQYVLVDKRQNGNDFDVHRLNKYVVESTGFTESVDFNLSESEALERYGIDYDGKKQIIGFRVGAGTTSIVDKNGRYESGVNYSPDLLSATMFNYNWKGYAYSGFSKFFNEMKAGDSGSAFYLYDKVQKKWVILGTLRGIDYNHLANVHINAYDKKTEQSLKDAYSQHVDLLGQKVKIENNNLIFADKTIALEKTHTQLPQDPNNKRYIDNNKDLIFKGGGTLVLGNNLDLNTGGFIFDNNNYTIDGKGLFYKGAGIDIAKGGEVNLNVETRDVLHKIGEGTLQVNVKQNNDYKTGNGTTYLNAEQSFNNIYLANGLATIVVNHENALKKDDFNGIYFTRAGGTLDLNGHDHSFKKIAATDIGARVVNSADKKINLNLTNTDKYAYHGELDGNMDVNHSFDKEDSNRVLVLDGNVNIKGDINVKNSSLVMQGHATTHAIFSESPCQNLPFPLGAKCYKDDFKNKEQAINNALNTSYKSNNQISSFEQDDFDKREFKFANLNLENATFSQGRDSFIQANINAHNSTVTLGSNKLYLDSYDGRNITNSGFSFRQELKEGESLGQSLYKGNLALDKNSTLKVYNIFDGSISAKDSHVIFGSESIALNELSLDKSNLDFDKKSYVVVKSKLTSNGTINLDKASLFVIDNQAAAQKSSVSNLQIKDKAKFFLVNNASLQGSVNLYDGSEFLLSSNSHFDGNTSLNDAILALKDKSSYQGEISANKSRIFIDTSSHAKANLNLDNNSTLLIHDNAYLEGNINATNSHIYVGSHKNTYSEHDLAGYNALVKGSINVKQGSLNLNNALYIVDGNSEIDVLRASQSAITSNREMGYKTININSLKANNTIFNLNTDLKSADKLTVKSVDKDSKDNSIIINTDKEINKDAVLNLQIATLPKDSNFKVLSRVVGFSEIKPVTYVQSNASSDDLVLSHYAIEPHNDTVANANSFMDTSYRNFVVEMNNLHKRMGDLRESEGESGIFARVMRGEGSSEYGYSDKYTHTQIGYDKKLTLDGVQIFNGLTLTYTQTDLSSNSFFGDTKSFGGGIYSAMLFDNGLYVDLIAKYIRHLNTMTAQFATLGENSFNNGSLYLGAELGYKYNLSASTSITPQAEFVYGYVSGSKININDNKSNYVLENKSYSPLVARLGFDLAHKMHFDNLTLTARAGSSAQFDIMNDAQTVLLDEYSYVKTNGDNDFRLLLNLGFDLAFDTNLRLSVEYNTSKFGKYNIDDEFNATLRYIF